MSALDTGLVHGGNQQLKVFAYDDVQKDEDKAKMPISTAVPKMGNTDNTLFHYYSKLFVTGSERASPEATTLVNKRVEKRLQLAARLGHIEESVEVGLVSQGNKTYGADGLSEYERQRKEVLEDQVKSWERNFSGFHNCQDGSSTQEYWGRGLGLFTSPAAVSLASDCDITDPLHRTHDLACVDLNVNALLATEVANRFVPDHLNGIMGSLFDTINGPNDYDVVCTRQFKEAVGRMLNVEKIVDGLTSVAKYNGDIEKKRLGFVVEIYVGDTGTLTFKMTTFFPTTGGAAAGTSSLEALILNWDKIWLHVRNKPGFYPVGNLNLSQKTAVAGTQGLACIPRYHGQITRQQS
jgi:hypothetical protein